MTKQPLFFVQTHHHSTNQRWLCGWRTVRSTPNHNRAQKWFDRLMQKRVSGAVRITDSNGQTHNSYFSPDCNF